MSKEFIGWEAELKDGTVIREGKAQWRDVPKTNIHRLSLLHYMGRRWDIVGKDNYFVKTRASEVPCHPETFRIESRTIGYYDRADKIHYTVNEFTGEFKMEVISNK